MPGLTDDPLLEVAGLAHRFGPLPVLDGLDLHVDAGEAVAVVGENGAGKTTLMRCIARDLVPVAGSIRVAGRPLGRRPADVRAQGLAFAWQDQSLCDDLDAVTNLFLGRERRHLLLDDDDMEVRARRVLARLGVTLDDLHRPVRVLTRGQRQSLAIARTLLTPPDLLVLDEPTAALDVMTARGVVEMLQRLHDEGTAMLVISHDPAQVLRLADRVLVLRRGRIVADVSPSEAGPEDLVALMSGAPTDSAARRQLGRLHSLADQLAEVTPAASLPLVVSALAAAIGQDSLCVHLRDEKAPVLRRIAAVGMPPALLELNETLPIGLKGGSVGVSAATGRVEVVEDVAVHPAWERFRAAAASCGITSAWAAPIVSNDRVVGTVSGYGHAPGALGRDQLDLLGVYTGYAAAAIEHERVLAEVTRRNRILEALREMLDKLAGPERVSEGMTAALLALCRGLGADVVGLCEQRAGHLELRAHVAVRPEDADDSTGILATILEAGPVRARGDARVLLAPLGTEGQVDGTSETLVAYWADGRRRGSEPEGLLSAAARSLRLAREGDALEEARREADAFRRSHALQRDLLRQLSHELRTPLTAVQGFAESLLQADVEWDEASERRFLRSIAGESERMRRLVGDLLDSAAISSGTLRLTPDWCDLTLVLRAAAAITPATIELELADDLPMIWGDHDRLEQVFVNLLENATRHGGGSEPIRVTGALDHAAPGGAPTVTVRVVDRGAGVPADVVGRLFQPHVRGPTGGAGLGLSIARGVVDAHGGRLELVPSLVGACFRVDLPVERVQSAQDDQDAALYLWELGEHG